jgi:hypothetical protein
MQGDKIQEENKEWRIGMFRHAMGVLSDDLFFSLAEWKEVSQTSSSKFRRKNNHA